MKPETLFDQLFFTTVHITDNHGSMGTGFFYTVPVDGGEATFIVTNKHVIKDASSIILQFIGRKSNGQPDLGVIHPIAIANFNSSSWIGHSDPDIDVAVIPIASVLDQAVKNGKTPYYVSLSPAIVPTKEQISELDSVVDVSFVGYPNGLYDSKNALPIIRRGSTASNLQVDYEGKPVVLIDASVFPGSSGSPVLVIQNGVTTSRGGSIALGQSIVYLIGIVAAMKQRTVVGQLIDTNTSLVSVSNEGIDLGIVYKARTIDECIDIALIQAGIKRSNSALPEIEKKGDPSAVDKKIADAQD